MGEVMGHLLRKPKGKQNRAGADVNFWVGGTISPSADQAVGSYEATVELTASYVGS